MTEHQKNAAVVNELNEMGWAALFSFALLLLLVVLGDWMSTRGHITLIGWIGHVEALGITLSAFVAAAAFQPDESFIQKHFTRLMQTFTGWC
jgi:hypothetical protein